MGARLEDVLNRPLANEDVVSLVIDHHGHPLPLEIKRDLVHLPATSVDIKIGMGKNRVIQQVAQPRLVVAVHVGVSQDVLALSAGHIDIFLQDHAVLGQSAGLVRAENVDRPEVLDRVEFLHDHLFAGHGQRSLGEVHRHHHREHFRRHAE